MHDLADVIKIALLGLALCALSRRTAASVALAAAVMCGAALFAAADVIVRADLAPGFLVVLWTAACALVGMGVLWCAFSILRMGTRSAKR